MPLARHPRVAGPLCVRLCLLCLDLVAFSCALAFAQHDLLRKVPRLSMGTLATSGTLGGSISSIRPYVPWPYIPRCLTQSSCDAFVTAGKRIRYVTSDIERVLVTRHVTLRDQEEYDKLSICMRSYLPFEDTAYSPPQGETIVCFDRLVDSGACNNDSVNTVWIRAALKCLQACKLEDCNCSTEYGLNWLMSRSHKCQPNAASHSSRYSTSFDQATLCKQRLCNPPTSPFKGESVCRTCTCTFVAHVSVQLPGCVEGTQPRSNQLRWVPDLSYPRLQAMQSD